MSEPFDKEPHLEEPDPEPPASDSEFVLLEDSEMSEEDRKEILEQIETVVAQNRIPVDETLFKISPRKRGALFPILLNLITILLIGGAVLFAFRYFQARQETLSLETEQYLSTEGKLIEELRKESQEKIRQKEQEIGQIQSELEELDRQSRELQEDMEARVEARAAELRKELEAELEAERERLIDQGVSPDKIEAQIEELEEQRSAEFSNRLEEYREEMQAELAAKEQELAEAKRLAEEILEEASRERAELEEEGRRREEELRAQFEEEREALETRSTEAEARLEELAQLRERESLITDQLIGAYEDVIGKIQTGDLEGAKAALAELETFIRDPSLQGLPTISKRKNIELFIIDTLRETLETRTANPAAETKSLLEAANLLVTAREIVSQADAASDAGDVEESRRLYRQALEAVPALNRAYKSIRTIEENRSGRAIRQAVTDAQNALREGDREAALAGFRQAAFMGAGSFEPLMRDALMGLERVFALDADEAIEAREGRLTEKDETIRRLNGEIGRLEEELEELETEKAAYEEQIEELGTENAAYEAEIEKRTAEAGESEQELNAKLASLEQSVAEKEERIGELEEEIASLREAADETEPPGAEVVEEGDDEKDEQIRRLEAELAEKEYQLESMRGTVSTEELERRVAAAREQSFQEVLDAIAYVTGGSTPSTKEEVEERVDQDPMYRNVFEEIKKIAEQEVEVTERVRVIESKLLGTISSVTAGRVIIEPLIDLEVEEGTKILIKRRTSSGEIPIAEGRVDEVAMGRLTARIEKRISTTRNPIVMDLVYLQIEGTEE